MSNKKQVKNEREKIYILNGDNMFFVGEEELFAEVDDGSGTDRVVSEYKFVRKGIVSNIPRIDWDKK